MGIYQQFMQQMINGISLGSIYALLALGYTMVYGIIRLINFAHGDILMLGAFGGFFVFSALGITPLTFLVAFLVAMPLCAIIGVIIERTCYKPLRNAPKINALITAIGVSCLIENGARVIPWIGPNFREFPIFSEKFINEFFVFKFINLIREFLRSLLGVEVSFIQVVVLLVSIVLMFLLNYIVNYTKTGKAMRAVSHDRNAAYLMGINVDGIISFTFAIGTALAAAAGILFASAYPQIEPNMGIIPGLKAFIAAVLGGIGNIPGALVGGLALGLVEAMGAGYISAEYEDVFAFVVLVVVLIFRPSGLLGQRVADRA